jgi:hypothetical protein
MRLSDEEALPRPDASAAAPHAIALWMKFRRLADIVSTLGIGETPCQVLSSPMPFLRKKKTVRR